MGLASGRSREGALTGNLTLGFGVANPGTGTTSVTCQNLGTSNSGFGFFSVFPPQVTLPAAHGGSVLGNAEGTTYEIILVQTDSHYWEKG